MKSKSNLKVSEIIESISPHYNRYIDQKAFISGAEALSIMWNIGKILEKYILDWSIAPHNLYRQIYGKSEGKDHIRQKSYITREFMGRCYRIKKIFSSNQEIFDLLPRLSRFTLFRESMPFFDNPKFKLDGDDREDLLNLLNSNRKPMEILKEIRKLQKRNIQVKNPRTQRLSEVEPLKSVFINSYNTLYELIRELDFDQIQSDFSMLKIRDFKKFSSVISALVSEEVVVPEFDFNGEYPTPFNQLAELLQSLFSSTDMKSRNRFRRLIKPERISILAEMVFALSNEELFDLMQSKFNSGK